jgi:hypothetical protein
MAAVSTNSTGWSSRMRAVRRPSRVRSTRSSTSTGRSGEYATSIDSELLPGGTFAALKFAGKDSRWNGNASS